MKRRRVVVGFYIVLLLFISLAWFRSYFYVDDLWYQTESSVYNMELDRGGLSVFFAPSSNYPEYPELTRTRFRSERRKENVFWNLDFLMDRQNLPGYDRTTDVELFGLKFGSGGIEGWGRAKWLVLPIWPLWTTISIFALTRIVLSRRSAHRLKNRLCNNCGYDLRGSVGCCPECGWEQSPRTE